MIKHLSVWLMMEKNSRDRCSQIIRTLSKKLQFPVFEPHCTLYGRLKCDPLDLEQLISFVAKDHYEFSTRVKGIKTGDSEWKCLYLSLKMNDTMRSIFSLCKEHLSSYCRYAFDPHASIAYGKHDPDNISNAAKRINAPEKLNFSGIALVRTGGAINNWEVLTYRHFGDI